MSTSKPFIYEVAAVAMLTTRKAAEALGVSESSLKRWCDQGLLDSVRTAGGHRRVEVRSLVAYARRQGQEIARPELLGLMPRQAASAAKLDLSAAAFTAALLRGDDPGCRFIARSSHLAGLSLADFGDRFVAAAFRNIGERWAHGEAHVYQERRACQVCLSVLDEIGQLLKIAPRGPQAIGGTLDGDPYTLPGTLAALVLRQNGWQAQSLGSGLPWETLVEAIRDVRPRLFWLSVSTIADVHQFIAGYRAFYEQAGQSTAIVVGGRALTEELRTQMRYAAYCDNLQHLEAFARSLHRRVTRQGE